MFLAKLLVQSDDFSSLGGFNHDDIPQNDLMELLVADFDDKTCFQSDGAFLQLSAWPGVVMDTEGSVEKIMWRGGIYAFFNGDGSIDFRWIPSTVTKFGISNNTLSGTLDAAVLPRGLRYLGITHNQICGTVDLYTVPRTMVGLYIGSNRLHGSLHLEDLPPPLEAFDASRNKFEGTLAFQGLPPSIRNIRLRFNTFCGSVDLRFLPESIRLVELGDCSIQQKVLVIPTSFRNHPGCIDLYGNSIDRVMDTDGVGLSRTIVNVF